MSNCTVDLEAISNRYITNSSDLNCRFNKSCAWMNVPDDDLLDTSDFYLFMKTDTKSFPVQIQPGPPDPPTGYSYIFLNNKQNSQKSKLRFS